MKIHEYQAKQLLREAGVAVPQSIVATHARRGGRRVQTTGRPARRREGPDPRRRPRQGHDQGQPQAARRAARRSRRRSRQASPATCSATSWSRSKPAPKAKPFSRVLVEAGCDIARELYLGIVVDRAAAMPVLMASSEGGMNIEEVAAEDARADLQGALSIPTPACSRYQVRKLCCEARTSPAPASARPRSSCRRSAKLFVELDCSLVEINPLVVTESGRADRARRQDQLRRQRPVPPPGPGRAARPGRRRPDRSPRRARRA